MIRNVYRTLFTISYKQKINKKKTQVRSTLVNIILWLMINTLELLFVIINICWKWKRIVLFSSQYFMKHKAYTHIASDCSTSVATLFRPPARRGLFSNAMAHRRMTVDNVAVKKIKKKK